MNSYVSQVLRVYMIDLPLQNYVKILSNLSTIIHVYTLILYIYIYISPQNDHFHTKHAYFQYNFFIISSLFPLFVMFVSIYPCSLMVTTTCTCQPYTNSTIYANRKLKTGVVIRSVPLAPVVSVKKIVLLSLIKHDLHVHFEESSNYIRGRRGRGIYNHWSCQFESRPGEAYSIQHYLIKFVSDLRLVGGFLWALGFPPPIKLISTI